MSTRARICVGIRGTVYTVFRAHTTPTEATYGGTYRGVIGPFRTRRAADRCANAGPWGICRTVAEFERAVRGGRP